jgi:hypothetical protein
MPSVNLLKGGTRIKSGYDGRVEENAQACIYGIKSGYDGKEGAAAI